MDLITAFGVILKKHRKLASISQEELAHRCELDRTYIGLLERGQRQPSLTTIFKLADALNILPENLIQEVNNSISKN